MAYPYSTKAPLNGQIPTKGQLSDKRSPYTSNCIYFLVQVTKCIVDTFQTDSLNVGKRSILRLVAMAIDFNILFVAMDKNLDFCKVHFYTKEKLQMLIAKFHF